jgi:hypothetical protein
MDDDRKNMARQDLIDYLTEVEALLDHAVAAATVCGYFPDVFQSHYKTHVSLLEHLIETHESTISSSADR